jgi:hypothetical protein
MGIASNSASSFQVAGPVGAENGLMDMVDIAAVFLQSVKLRIYNGHVNCNSDLVHLTMVKILQSSGSTAAGME